MRKTDGKIHIWALEGEHKGLYTSTKTRSGKAKAQDHDKEQKNI